MVRWQLQEAKSRFSELIRECEKGPQIVSKSGKDQAVVLSFDEYKKLVGEKPHFLDFINSSPLKGIEIDLTRDRSLPRESDL